ncbi:hypothetical protein, partial [Halomonas sp. Alg239-R46]|uniref:hypothetical protein n=1 Tax=Halomonas sp. Alg239-R46 TaxID=2993445 RepID=UPI00248E259F
CESRSSSGTYTAENPATRLGFLLPGRKEKNHVMARNAATILTRGTMPPEIASLRSEGQSCRYL